MQVQTSRELIDAEKEARPNNQQPLGHSTYLVIPVPNVVSSKIRSWSDFSSSGSRMEGMWNYFSITVDGMPRR